MQTIKHDEWNRVPKAAGTESNRVVVHLGPKRERATSLAREVPSIYFGRLKPFLSDP